MILQFSRYLANAISPDRSNTFGSSDSEDDEDEDDADAGWLGTSQFDSGDVDFSLGEASSGPTKFGFDERFESAGQAFRTTSPDSDDVRHASSVHQHLLRSILTLP